ncbi:MAG: hypothetical protein ABR512_10410 [Desulfopila sp.]
MYETTMYETTMDKKFDTTHPVNSALKAMISQTGKIPFLMTSLDINFDHVPFHLDINKNKATVFFDKWSDGLALFRKIKEFADLHYVTPADIEELLATLNITIYLQSRHLAVIGPQAGIVLPRIFAIIASFLQRKMR